MRTGWSWKAKLSALVATLAAGSAWVVSCNAVLNADEFTYGACAAKGERRCVNNTLEECSASGQWMTSTACEGTACDADAGKCVGTCAPDQTRCSPTSLHQQLCNTRGEWQDDRLCQFICKNGACAGECKPGEIDCSGVDTVRAADGPATITCSDAGEWVSDVCVSHPGTEWCVHGACTQCQPGKSRCWDKLKSQLCGDAGLWLPTHNCAPDEECFNNSGTCDKPCNPGDIPRCTTGDIVQVCSDGGVWVDETSCAGACSRCDAGACEITKNASCKANCITQGTCSASGDCIANDGGAVQCVPITDDAGTCNTTSCDTATGRCSEPNGTACSTGDVCASPTQCQDGVCADPPAVAVDHTWAHWKFVNIPPSDRFVAAGEVVYDRTTHLMWMAAPDTKTRTNTGAQTFCNCLNVSAASAPECSKSTRRIEGYPEGWRLPSRVELVSIVNYGAAVATDELVFPNFQLPPTLIAIYWTSSAAYVAPLGTQAWSVNFQTGLVKARANNETLAVRCVR